LAGLSRTIAVIYRQAQKGALQCRELRMTGPAGVNTEQLRRRMMKRRPAFALPLLAALAAAG